MMIKGQEKICSLIDNTALDQFPRSLMLVGPRGSGKHLLSDYIANKFSLQLLNITETLDQETIDEIYNRVQPYLYIIEANKISVKEENTILKFLEEPLKNSFIVLLAETDIGLLQTILNRCQIWHLQNYSKNDLYEYLTDKNNVNVLDIAKTPGQVKELENINLQDAIELADKIITKIHIAGVANTLTISNKVSYKETADNKVNVNVFVDILLNRLNNYCKENNDQRLYSAYFKTAELSKLLSVKNLDQKSLFEQYLISLRDIMRG